MVMTASQLKETTRFIEECMYFSQACISLIGLRRLSFPNNTCTKFVFTANYYEKSHACGEQKVFFKDNGSNLKQYNIDTENQYL